MGAHPHPAPRLDELATEWALFIDSGDPKLRTAPISSSGRNLFDRGSVVVVAPALNNAIHFVTRRYSAHLLDRDNLALGFDTVSLESFIFRIAEAGAATYAQALNTCYCDLLQVDGELCLHLAETIGSTECEPVPVRQLTDQSLPNDDSTKAA